MGANRQEPSSQLKQVTIVFADLTGFTAMSETLDPEQVRNIVNRYFDRMAAAVHNYGGTVDKYMGDALMAVFGVPAAHENDPERACRAALEMMDAAKQLAGEIELPIGAPPTLHIGIETGPVVAAPMGSKETSQFTVMGDAVNLASRLLHEAEDGEIVVGPSTWEPLQGVFEFASPVHRSIKGKAGKVPTYQLLGTRGADVQRRRPLPVPLVGRRRELQLAEGLLDDAVARHGSLLYITGLPGIGKSRLVEEIEFSARTRGFQNFSAIAEPLGSMQPYGLWRQILFAVAGIAPNASDTEAATSLKAFIGACKELQDHAPALQATCGFEAKEFEMLSDEGRERAVALAWKVLLQVWQAENPAMFVLDDIQWADPLSVKLVDALGDSLSGMGILLCCVARPEFQHGWATRSYYQQINIRPLNAEESIGLIRELTGEKKLEPDQEAWIAGRAEGNPFYMAELTRAVAEKGTTELPATVQGIILQRVDQLEEQARGVLEVASVIGREFPEKVLRAVSEANELEGKLEHLRRLELIYEKQIVPELQYIFKHYLTQEATYNSILIERRKQIHQQVAAAIESTYQDSLERHYAVLAQHYESAGELQKAFDYYRRAGEHAQQTQSDSVAIDLYNRSDAAFEKLHVGGATLRGKEKQLVIYGIAMFISTFIGGAIVLYDIIFEENILLMLVLTSAVAAIGTIFLFIFSMKTWSFTVYPDKLRVKQRNFLRDIPFNQIEKTELVSWKEWAGWKKIIPTLRKYYSIVLDPRYSQIGFAQTSKLPWVLRHAIKVECGGFGWRKGCYLEMDNPKQFYVVLIRALERYRVIHGSPESSNPTVETRE